MDTKDIDRIQTQKRNKVYKANLSFYLVLLSVKTLTSARMTMEGVECVHVGVKITVVSKVTKWREEKYVVKTNEMTKLR